MLNVNDRLTAADLLPKIGRLWEASGRKIDSIDRTAEAGAGAPVFTVRGRYTARGWTEWTEGFQYGSAVLQFDATGDEKFLRYAYERTRARMASHVSHIGVHDHGFNNVSTYGNLWRLMNEGRLPEDEGNRNYYELALKVSGAVQAARWRTTHDGTGYIYSFNGPQSLFVDTIRSCRALAVAHDLGHVLMGEQDEKISLLGRMIEHATNTARYNVYYGEGRDFYDISGRTAHESLFNVNDGRYRAPSTQQGYSAFSTWTRGLAWAMTGFAEQLEWLATRPDEEFEPFGGRAHVAGIFQKAATATCDFYLQWTPADGIPYWDTGAPGLTRLGDYLDRPADPYNAHEPVDSSAAAIAAQGLLRLGRHLDEPKYWQAGLTVCDTLFDEPYLSTDPEHQGLILHSVYHRPNGWDHIADGQSVPNGESSMWGDYHAREVALYLQRAAKDEPYYTFFSAAPAAAAATAPAADTATVPAATGAAA